MYAYCYIFFYPVLYNKTHIQNTYNAIRRNLKLVKLSLEICFGEEYHYTLGLIR